MEPYTASGMERLESDHHNNTLSTPHTSTHKPADSTHSTASTHSDSSNVGHLNFNNSLNTSNMNEINYELVGVVVHSGQANAGHYYSFIKDRR